MEMYYHSVGRGAVLLLNHAPEPNGRRSLRRTRSVPPSSEPKYSGALAIALPRRPVLATSSSWTVKRLVTIDHVITMEDIAQGERVREYAN